MVEKDLKEFIVITYTFYVVQYNHEDFKVKSVWLGANLIFGDLEKICVGL